MKRLWLILGILTAVSVIAFTCAAIGIMGSGANPIDSPLPAVAEPEEPTLEITYIANEGVLISSGDRQVLIDGLHREYKRAYAYVPAEERERIENAKAPYDEVDLVLVSHVQCRRSTFSKRSTWMRKESTSPLSLPGSCSRKTDGRSLEST